MLLEYYLQRSAKISIRESNVSSSNFLILKYITWSTFPVLHVLCGLQDYNETLLCDHSTTEFMCLVLMIPSSSFLLNRAFLLTDVTLATVKRRNCWMLPRRWKIPSALT